MNTRKTAHKVHVAMLRLVAGFCAVGMLATSSADDPVAGWNLARWGMTTAENSGGLSKH